MSIKCAWNTFKAPLVHTLDKFLVKLGAGRAPSSNRNHQLDFLRGIAILLVLGRHCPMEANQAGLLHVVAWLWYNCGWMGVDLFFVLSGFLIGSALLEELKREKNLQLGRFLFKRALKIWPSYFAFMVLVSFGLNRHIHEQQLIWNWFHLQNYMGSCKDPTWSLAVEEHFYILLPIILVLLSTRIHLLPYITAFVSVFCLIGRCLDATSHSYYFTHFRIDGLMFGVFLAYMKVFRFDLYEKVSKHPRLLLFIGILLVLPSALLDMYRNSFVVTVGLTLNYIGFASILVGLLNVEKHDGIVGSLLFSRLANWIAKMGFFSYGIYLWHMDFGSIPTFAINQVFLGTMPNELRWISVMALFVVLSVFSGVVLSKLIEMPVLRLRDKLVILLFSSKVDATPVRSRVTPAQTPNTSTLVVKPIKPASHDAPR